MKCVEKKKNNLYHNHILFNWIYIYLNTEDITFNMYTTDNGK